MTKKESYKQFIIDHLRKGIVRRDRVMANFVKHWHTSSRTFDRYWTLAQNEYAIEVEALQKENEDKYLSAKKEIAKCEILTRIKIEELVSEIALGGKGVSNSDRLKAIDLLCKMGGHYAPTKIAPTDTEGNHKPMGFVVASVSDLLKMQ